MHIPNKISIYLLRPNTSGLYLVVTIFRLSTIVAYNRTLPTSHYYDLATVIRKFRKLHYYNYPRVKDTLYRDRISVPLMQLLMYQTLYNITLRLMDHDYCDIPWYIWFPALLLVSVWPSGPL